MSQHSELIGDGKVVELAYQLKNSEGEILDEAAASEPFVYLHGTSQIVPGLEGGLTGLKVGDKKKVVVPPAGGYGEVDSELKITVKRSQFPGHLELEVGMQFESRNPTDPEGQGMVFTIASIEDEMVGIDGNHPLAGVTLHFDVEVLSIRDATEEEKSHGHAHGAHGHGHGHDHDHDDLSDEEDDDDDGGQPLH